MFRAAPVQTSTMNQFSLENAPNFRSRKMIFCGIIITVLLVLIFAVSAYATLIRIKTFDSAFTLLINDSITQNESPVHRNATMLSSSSPKITTPATMLSSSSQKLTSPSIISSIFPTSTTHINNDCKPLDGKARLCRTGHDTLELYDSFSGNLCYQYEDIDFLANLYEIYRRCVLTLTDSRLFFPCNQRNQLQGPDRRYTRYIMATKFNHSFHFERDIDNTETADLIMNIASRCYLNMSQTANFFRFIIDTIRRKTRKIQV